MLAEPQRHARPHRWSDGVSPGPSNATYGNWGTYNGLFNSQSGLNLKEPNSYDYPPEYCGAADYFEAITLPGGKPWGWNDQNCILRYAFICKFWPRESAGGLKGLTVLCRVFLACVRRVPLPCCCGQAGC